VVYIPHPQRYTPTHVARRQASQSRRQGSAANLNHASLDEGGVLDLSAGEVIGLPTPEPDTTPPPAPTAPVLNLSMGAVGIRYDGLFAGGAADPGDVAYTYPEYRMDGGAWDAAQPIPAGKGGTVIYGLPAGTVEVRLVSVDTSGNQSLPSATRSLTVVPIETADSVRQALQDYTAQAEQDLADLDAALSGRISTAKSEAIAAAATDATEKANAAQQAAESAAQAAAEAAAATAKAEALTEAATTAQQKAEAAAATAKAEALTEAATAAQALADAAAADALQAAKTHANNAAEAARASAVSTAAADAQGKFDTAKSAADAAAQAAADAAGIAQGKADVLIQSTAPATAMRKATTLWIDTTGGNNTPKRWDGSTWAAVTDKTAMDAAAAASSAASTASQALTAAENAHTLAGDAAENATVAFNRASDAETNAKSHADTVAGTAKSEAISAAATDATSKANTAKSEAISAAATDATSKANTAKSEAISAAQADATSKANAAKTAAEQAAAAYANSIAGGGINLFDPAAFHQYAFWSNNYIDPSTSGKLYSFPVTPGEVYSLSRANNSNDRFRVGFAAGDVAPQRPIFGVIEGGSSLAIEGFTVPSGATHMFVYLTLSSQTLPRTKLERGPKATAWTPSAGDVEATAEAAKQAAIAAAEADATAKANAAQTAATNVANALPKVLHGTGNPSGTAPNGSIWWKHQGTLGGRVIGQWNRVDGAWVSTPIDSEAIANLDVGKLTVGSADVGELVTAKLLANEAIFNRLTSRSGWVGGVMLEDGAVTAEKMNFVREGTRARLRIVPEGIILESNRADGAEVFRLDGESPLTWSVMDSATGDVVASVSEDGEFSGAAVHAGDGLTWRGTSMDEYLWNMPWGVRYRGLRGSNPANSSTSSTHVQPFMRLEWQALRGRQYEVRVFNLTMTASSESLKARMMIREAVGSFGGGIRATMSSSVKCTNYSGRRLSANSAHLGTHEVKYKHVATVNADVSNLFCWSAWGGVGSVNISTSSTDPVFFEVVDLGPHMDLETAGHGTVPLPTPVVPPTAVALDGGPAEGSPDPSPPPAETRTYVETWTTTGTAYWRGSTRYTGQMIQGYTTYDPGGGRKEGLAVFNLGNRYNQTMVAALNGATVEKVEVYVYFDHWHSAAGGTAGIALHDTHGNLPGSSTLGPVFKTVGFKRGEGKWITLGTTGSAIGNGFKNGTYRGFGIKAPDSTSQYYGTAYGGTSTWKAAKIRITYTK